MQIKYGSRGSGSTCSSKTTLKASLDNNLKSQLLRVYLASRGESRQIPKKANKAASFNHVTDVPLIYKNKFRCMKKQKQLHFPKIMSKFKPHHNCKSSPKKNIYKTGHASRMQDMLTWTIDWGRIWLRSEGSWEADLIREYFAERAKLLLSISTATQIQGNQLLVHN